MTYEIKFGRIIDEKRHNCYLVRPIDGGKFVKVIGCYFSAHSGDVIPYKVTEVLPGKTVDIGKFVGRTQLSSIVVVGHTVFEFKPDGETFLDSARARYFGIGGFGRIFDRAEEAILRTLKNEGEHNFLTKKQRRGSSNYFCGWQTDPELLDTALQPLLPEYHVKGGRRTRIDYLLDIIEVETDKDFQPCLMTHEKFASDVLRILGEYLSVLSQTKKAA